MRFLSDQDVYATTVQFLRELGHDVVTAAELGLSRSVDEHLLERATAFVVIEPGRHRIRKLDSEAAS